MILRLKVYRLLLKMGIYLVSLLAFYVGWWVWTVACGLLGRPALYTLHGHFNQLLFGSLVWAMVSEHYKVTTFDELFRDRTRTRAIVYACVATSFVLLATLYFSRNALFPRGLLVCDVAAIFALTTLVQFAFLVLCRSHADMGKPSTLLVVGADEFALESARRLHHISFAPCLFAGFVRLPEQRSAVHGHRIYEMEQLNLLDSGMNIDEALIAIRPAQFDLIPTLTKALEHLCVPVRAVVDLGEGVAVGEKLFQMGSVQLLNLNPAPTESLAYALLKRAFDIAFSTLVLLLTAPLFALLASMIRLSSPGPIFFAQERVGLNGKPFRMLKFRTMRMGSKVDGDTHWTTASDPRRTRLGSFLRHTSLDELPQFINVLKGEMSVVGPRPERPFFVRKFLDEFTRYNQRHSLKVGITGWAQVNGWRGDTSIQKRVEYDLYYLQNWSFGFDLRIILMTLFSGLINKNAY